MQFWIAKGIHTYVAKHRWFVVIASVIMMVLLFAPFDSTFAQQRPLLEPCTNPDSLPGRDADCRDANILLLQVINIGQFLFQFIGTLAFVMFIYGGFSIILSLGNPEKAKKGHATLFAAAVGILISFSAYILVNFLLDALGVQREFRA